MLSRATSARRYAAQRSAPRPRRVVSMIPTSTGAAKAVGLVLPELAGKLDGTVDPRTDAERRR